MPMEKPHCPMLQKKREMLPTFPAFKLVINSFIELQHSNL